MIIIIILVLIFIGVVIHSVTKTREQKSLLDEALSMMKDFEPTHIVRNDTTVYYFAVDRKREEIFCFSNSKGVRFRFKDIVSAEILIDGDVTETHKSASLGGAVAGGLLAGGLGAVVGGASMGKSTSVKKMKSLKIHILLRNAKQSSFDIEFLDGGYEVKTTSIIYTVANQDSRSIFDELRIAMDKVKEADVQPSKTIVSQKSNVEELKELAELKQQGLITEEEFATMKAKIINK